MSNGGDKYIIDQPSGRVLLVRAGATQKAALTPAAAIEACAVLREYMMRRWNYDDSVPLEVAVVAALNSLPEPSR